ncbi:MAG: GNAT family N-acetyltransferase [Candidatus Spyradocola sp.]
MTERALDLNDIPQLLALQQATYDGLPRREFLMQTEEEELTYIFSGGGIGTGLFDGGRLVGAWVLYYPFDREDNLGPLLGTPPERTAHFELALLDPALRGRGLHRDMVRRLTGEAARDGRFTHIAATAHPDNAASVRGFTANGYTVAGTYKMYGGLDRCVLYRAL